MQLFALHRRLLGKHILWPRPINVHKYSLEFLRVISNPFYELYNGTTRCCLLPLNRYNINNGRSDRMLRSFRQRNLLKYKRNVFRTIKIYQQLHRSNIFFIFFSTSATLYSKNIICNCKKDRITANRRLQQCIASCTKTSEINQEQEETQEGKKEGGHKKGDKNRNEE